MRPQILIGAFAALFAGNPTYANAGLGSVSVDAAILAATELCPEMVARNDGSVDFVKAERFKFSEPTIGSDRTIWKVGIADQTVLVTWLPLRRECSVMHRGEDKDLYFTAIQSFLSDKLGYQQAQTDEDSGYITVAYRKLDPSTGIATHFVIVKTKDGRWVNVWFGNGNI